MDKTVKKVLISLLVILLTLFLLFVLLIISVVKSRSETGANYMNNAPSFCPNTRWVCQEEDIYFTTDANGLIYGVSNVTGEQPFKIVFGLEPIEHFNVCVIYPDENGVIQVTHSVFSGHVTYAEGRCTLDYDATRDERSLFGEEEEGRVTRTFLREDLPEPFDFARDAANTKWVCQEKDIWFSSDENGALHGESRVNGEAVPFRLYCGQAPAYYSATVRQQDEQENVTELTAFNGAVWLDEEHCFLQYEAGPLLDPLWKQEEGFVILRFLREELPPLSDWGDPIIQWTCAEKNVVWRELKSEGRGYGDIIVDGEELWISLFFGPGEMRFYAEPEPGDGAEPVPGLMGSASFEDGRCILQFAAGQSSLFGPETEGTVTLSFLREHLPKPADFPGNN